MTLGGLALAVGILVDDATVTIENIERYLEEGNELRDAILNGASQIAVPALVSTLCICIVFVPMFFLSGVARYLFVPLAEAVVFAMLASYVLSRTLVPTMAMYLLRRNRIDARARRAIRWCGCSGASNAASSDCAAPIAALLTVAGAPPRRLHPGLPRCAASRSSRCCPGSARTSSRTPTAASSSCTCAPRPARASRRPRGSPTWSRPPSGRIIPPRELDTHPRQHRPALQRDQPDPHISGVIGAADADIMVSLKPDHRPTAGLRRGDPRGTLAQEFPGVDLLFPAGRHRHPDPELRPAGADRHPDRRHRHRRQPRSSPTSILEQVRAGAGHRRCAHPAALRLPELRGRRRPHQGAAERPDRARRGQQRARHAERQFPDRADVLPEPAERRQLQPRGPGAAIRHRSRCRTCRTSRSPARAAIAGDPGRSRDHQAVAGNGGRRPLQHPPRGRHLRQRAGARPRRGRPRRRRASSMPTAASCRAAASSPSAARSRPCAAPTRAWPPASASRSCSSTC